MIIEVLIRLVAAGVVDYLSQPSGSVLEKLSKRYTAFSVEEVVVFHR